MGISASRFALFSLIGLSGFIPAARAAEPTTEPFQLTPTRSPAAAANAPDPVQYRYPEVVEVVHTLPPADFERGRFELTLGGQGFTAHGDRGNDSIGFVTFDFAWYFANSLSLGLEIGIAPGTSDRHRHHEDHSEEDNGVRATEEMVMLRWHCLTVDVLSLYVDGGVGGLHADPGFPSGGRSDNFLAAVGGGVTLRLTPHFYAGAGARAAWLSGGDWDGNRRHHRWSDGVQYYGELTWMLP